MENALPPAKLQPSRELAEAIPPNSRWGAAELAAWADSENLEVAVFRHRRRTYVSGVVALPAEWVVAISDPDGWPEFRGIGPTLEGAFAAARAAQEGGQRLPATEHPAAEETRQAAILSDFPEPLAGPDSEPSIWAKALADLDPEFPPQPDRKTA